MMNLNNQGKSIIKFGAMDINSFTGPIIAMKTIENKWQLKSDEVWFGQNLLVSDSVVEFSPHLPYLYVSSDSWVQFAY